MGIQVSWDNQEEGVIAYTSSGHWTWDDFYGAIGEVCLLAKAVDTRVIVVMDLRSSVPPNGNALLHFQNAMKRIPANINDFVYIGAVGFKRILISMASKVMFGRSDIHFLFADSVEDAHLMILQERAKLRQHMPEI